MAEAPASVEVPFTDEEKGGPARDRDRPRPIRRPGPSLRNRETFTPLSLRRFARFPLPAGERERRLAAHSPRNEGQCLQTLYCTARYRLPNR